jgi:hypothetical protein
VQFEFGQRVRDKISGLEGYVVGRTEYFTGCVHIGVAPAGVNDKGGAKEWEWFDVRRIEAADGEPVDITGEAPLGGPMPNPPSA